MMRTPSHFLYGRALPAPRGFARRLVRAAGVTGSLAMIVGASAVAQSQSDAAIHRHYDAAYRLQSEGKLAEADREHRLFVAGTLHHVANARANVGAYDRAKPLFEEARRLAPGDVDLRIDAMKAAMDAEDPRNAEAIAEELQASPAAMDAAKRALVLRIHAEALRGLGRQKDAIAEFRAAAAADPSFDNLYALGNACLWVGDKADGVKVFSGMQQKFEDSAALHFDFGRGYAQAGYFAEAIAEFQTAVGKNSSLRGVHYSLGAAYLSLGGPTADAQAETEFRKELNLNPDDPFSYPQLGRIALDRQNYREAAADLHRALALNAGNADTWLLMAQLDAETQQTADAIAALRKAIAFTVDPSRNHYAIHAAHYQLGRLLMQTGDAAGARKEMQIAEDLLSQSDQQDANTLAGKAQVQLPLETIRVATAAEKAEERAYETSVAPLMAASYNNLGVHAAMGGEYADAAGWFAQAAAWNPELTGVDSNWGRAAFAAHDYAQAAGPLKRMLEKQPGDAGVRVDLGVSLYFTQDYGGAVRALRPIAATFTANSQLANLYAECREKAAGGATGAASSTMAGATPAASQQ